MKKFLSILLSVIILIVSLPVGNITAFAVTSGTTGDCTWTLDGTVLTISGNGATAEHFHNNDIWSNATALIIEEGVTHIGSAMFFDCTNLISVTIPSSLVKVGDCAFYNCSNLTNVYISDIAAWCNIDYDYVEYADAPLQYADNLYLNNELVTNIVIPEGVTRIPQRAFSCDSLQSIIIPNSVTYIDAFAFCNCDSLTTVSIPNSVKFISSYVFAYCDNLTSITIPNSITSINEGAFDDCTNLTDVYFTGSESDKEKISIYYNDYLLNANWHYNTCESEHIYTNVCDSTCNSCEWVRENGHTYTNDCDVDCDICGDIRADAHVYDNGCDADCNVCGIIRTPEPHKVNAVIYTIENLTEFPFVLSEGVYSSTNKTDNSSAVFKINAVSDGDLTIQYYTSTEQNYDELLINKNDSNLITKSGETSWSSINIPVVKGDVVYIKYTKDGSQYSGDDVVKFKLSQNAINFEDAEAPCEEDLVCVVCGLLIKEAVGHKYSSDCDINCNACGFIREVNAEHTYTNNFDTKCNICGDMRSVEELASITVDGITYTITPSENGGLATLTECPVEKSGALTIPDKVENCSVTAIGDSAFSGCTSLIKVTIPNSVTIIGSYAFDNCNSLVNITIPSSVKSIGSSAFDDCNSLTNVYISDIAAWCNINFYGYSSNPLDYANKLYLNNELVKDIVIPEGVTSIPHYAFSCENIESITIPSSVKSIGRDAFGDNLKNVYIKDLSAWCNIDFYDYYSSYPLYSANKLYINNELVKDIVIPEGVTSIPKYAFSCENVESITIPSSVTSIELSAFSGCTNLQNIFIDDNNPIYADVEGVLIDKSIETLIFCPKATKLTSLSIPTSVKSIGDSAFYGCTSLIKVTIPNSVTSIGSSAFSGCTSLINLTIPGSVTSIGSSAFRGCTSLIKATLQEGVETIENNAFYNCNSLVNITIPSSVTSIGYNAFDSCNSLTNVYISDIAAWCNIDLDDDYYSSFSSSNPLYYANKLYINNELVKDIVIPEGVTSIPKYAFSCENIESITIPSSVKSIGRNAFGYNLKNVYINDLSAWCNINFGIDDYYWCNPLNYAENLYLNNELVIDLVIPDDVTAIPNYAFYTCDSIRSVTISGSVTSIGAFAFANCDNLTSVSLPKNLSILEASVFIGSYNLKKIFIPKSLQLIKKYNFSVDYEGNSKLTDIYYEGTEQEWAELNDGFILEGNDGLNNATVHYNATELEPDPIVTSGTTGDCTWKIEDGVLTISGNGKMADYGDMYGDYWPEIPWDIRIKKVVVENGVTAIGYRAFDNYGNISSIALPSSITSIGGFAFRNCSGVIKCNSGSYAESFAIENGIDYRLYTQVAPASPVVLDVTGTTIKVTAVENCEYSVDGINWQSSNLFTGLTPNTQYTVYQRLSAFEDIAPSAKSVGTTAKTLKVQNPTTPAAPTVENLGIIDVTLTAKDGYEYSMDGETWQTSNIFTGLSANTTYTFYQRTADNNNYFASAKSEALVVTTLNKIQPTEIPAAPVLSSVNINFVALESVKGYEYSMDGETWQTSNVFSGLEADTEYTFYQRKAETELYLATEKSVALIVKTKQSVIAGDVTGDDKINDRDAVYLLYATLLSEEYPIDDNCDLNGDGVVNDRDAIYLLYHSFLPDKYPLN